MLWRINNGNREVRTGRDEQAHLNHGVVLPDTAGNFRCFVGYWHFRELPNFGGDTIMPSFAYIHDARHA